MAKCRYCGKEIDPKSAVLIKHGKANWYYCVGHEKVLDIKDTFYEELQEMLGKKFSAVVFKELGGIADQFGYAKMLHYIRDKRKSFEYVATKDFSNDYGLARYLSSIFNKHLPNYKDVQFASQIRRDVELIDISKKPIKFKKKKGLNDLFKELEVAKDG